MRGPTRNMLGASLLSAALLFGNHVVSAQGNNPYQPLPGITVKACEVEGTMVAQSLGLSALQTVKLLDAYKTARESVMGERAQIAKYVGVDYAYIRKSMGEERAKLEADMQKFLSPEQTKNAIVLLGGFSRRWDAMAMMIDGAVLDAQSKTEATKRLLRFVAETDSVIQEAFDENGLEVARQKVGGLKKALDADMKKIFSREQMDKWINATEQSSRNSNRSSEADRNRNWP